MKALATRPTTPEDILKRGIALALDEAFIGIGKNDHRLNTAFAKDFDVLVDKLAAVAMRGTAAVHEFGPYEKAVKFLTDRGWERMEQAGFGERWIQQATGKTLVLFRDGGNWRILA